MKKWRIVIAFLMLISIFQSVDFKAVAKEDGFIISNKWSSVTITGYNGTAKKIVIPEKINGKPVTIIGERAFYNKGIEQITLPSTIKLIKKEAFKNNKLQEVTIPESVTSIGDRAFETNKLQEIIIPYNVENIGDSVFENNQLKKVKLSNKMKNIRKGTFKNNKLKGVTIPETVEYIGSGAFENNQLEKVKLPERLKDVGWNTFKNNKLKEITIPSSVTNLGYSVFENNQLEKVKLSEGLETIGWYAFKDNKLKELMIPKSVKIIAFGAFENNQLEKVKLSEGLKGIDVYAFKDNKLKEITIPKSVTSIDSGAFENNRFEKIIFKKAIKVTRYSFLVNTDQAYTDKNYKNKWNDKVNKAMTIYVKSALTEATKRVKVDHISNNQLEFSNLEPQFSYSLYKDAKLTKKIKTFSPNKKQEVRAVKGIGVGKGTLYIIARQENRGHIAKKINYDSAYTSPLKKGSININHAKKTSIIGLTNLKAGTKYTLYTDTKKQHKIASFTAKSKTKKIKTKLLKQTKFGHVYVTTKQANRRESKAATICYPSGIFCPTYLPPSGAKFIERDQSSITYQYNKKLPYNVKIEKVEIVKTAKNKYEIIVPIMLNKDWFLVTVYSDDASKTHFLHFDVLKYPTTNQLAEVNRVANIFMDIIPYMEVQP